MVYLILRGRIGNQLFEYAFAEAIRQENKIDNIIVDDSEVENLNWVNSLKDYRINNIKFVHTRDEMRNYLSPFQILLFKIYHKLCRNKNYQKKYSFEKRFQHLFNSFGIVICENGYLPFHLNCRKNVLVDGYFQSEKYFYQYKDIIKENLSSGFEQSLENYSGIKELRNRNSVCISIKVEHNIGSSLYDVCSKAYWEEAIKYICSKVENPLFFICSDNVQYVLDNLLDANKYDYVIQDQSQPVHISLAAMSECDHFIIGNTTFGWWAQYLSVNENKIVIAPSKWMLVDMPIDIYQENWRLIEV